MTDLAPPLLPVRMLNEHVYCPRLFALEWMNREWAESSDTVEGRGVHRRVDRESREVPAPDPDSEADKPRVARSVLLGDDALGLIARIDLMEVDADEAVPVDYKRGTAPSIPEGAWPPERVQVCAQGLLLRAHGYRCDRGVLYFAASKRRVDVLFDDALIAETLAHRDAAQALAATGTLPEPLVDSQKCPRCSLVGICLPDETQFVKGRLESVRPLLPRNEDGLPLYVQHAGARVGLRGEEVAVTDRDGKKLDQVPLADVNRLVVHGNVSVSAPLLAALAARDISVAWHSAGGWYLGTFQPASGRNVMSRIAQHAVAADPVRSLVIARVIVVAKIRNQRVLLRRNGHPTPEQLAIIDDAAAQAETAIDANTLRGFEGVAARAYFDGFPTMVRGPLAERFEAAGRTRRPPMDPVNALLSFAYAMLSREAVQVLHGVGLDPFVGLLHTPRYGRPSLALDLIEAFRPVLADSAVITALNNNEIQADSFLERPTGVALTDAGRRAFVRTFERRLAEEAKHPVLGTTLSYRRILEVQARLLAKTLTGELSVYPELRIR